MSEKFLWILTVFCILKNIEAGPETIETCLTTKINIERNISVKFCGLWSCTLDKYFGTEIPYCVLLGPPRVIRNCIGYDEPEICGFFKCIIKTPYLHLENCVTFGNKLATFPPICADYDLCEVCLPCPKPQSCHTPKCRCSSIKDCPDCNPLVIFDDRKCPQQIKCPDCPKCKPCAC